LVVTSPFLLFNVTPSTVEPDHGSGGSDTPRAWH
jgi:hypothetical protein